MSQSYIRKPKWYQKAFAAISLFSSVFMFAAFSGSYSTTMSWIDLQIGRIEMRGSEGIRWVNAAIGSGVEVNAQLSVAVVEDIPKRIEDALVAVVSSVLQSILGTVQQIFSGLIDKVQEMSNVFASLGEQAGNMRIAIQGSIWPEIEQRFSSLEFVDQLLGSGVSDTVRNAMGDAVSRYRFASVAQNTADPSAPAAAVPSQRELDQAAQTIRETANAACASTASPLPIFDEIIGYYRPGCAKDASAIEQVINDDSQVVSDSVANVTDRAPADCKIAFADFSLTSFDPSSIDVGVASGFTGQTIQSDFLDSLGSYSNSTSIDVLTPDECDSLQGSQDVALAGTNVTPPSNSGAAGLSGVIQTFIDTIVSLINDLINSVIKIALDALKSVFNAFPRIFNEGFNQLVGNFSNIIQTNLSNITSSLTSFENTIKTPDVAVLNALRSAQSEKPKVS